MNLRRDFERHGEPVRVSCELVGDRQWQILIDGDEYQARAHRSPGNQVVFRLGERFLVATVSPAADGTLHVRVDGHTWTVRKYQPSRGGGAEGNGVLTAPMTGTVLGIMAEVGDKVAAGDTVALVTAMKMEHKIVADIDGEIVEIGAEAGAQVDQGQVLVRIQADED